MIGFKNIFYINLEKRTDRKLHVEKQLANIGLEGIRFNAIEMENGAIGCSLSHLKCLEMAKKNEWDEVMIVEDDITFLDPPLFKKTIYNFFDRHKEWDVLLLGGNNIPPYQNIDDCCIKISHCQTTTGYIVKKHYYLTLIENIKTGLNHLLREPTKHFFYAIDKYWLKLQKKDKWYLLIPLSVVQQPGYSDIEKKNTNYVNMLTAVNKIPLYRPPTL